MIFTGAPEYMFFSMAYNNTGFVLFQQTEDFFSPFAGAMPPRSETELEKSLKDAIVIFHCGLRVC